MYNQFLLDIDFKQSLAISYTRLGDIYLQWDHRYLPKALEFYKIYKKLYQKMLKNYSTNLEFNSAFALSHLYIGKVYEKLNKTSKAKQYFDKGKNLFVELVKKLS